MTDSTPIIGILLAAGQGSRYRAAQPNQSKLLALLPTGKTVLESSCAALQPVVDQLIVVVHPERNPFQQVPPPAASHVLLSPESSQGMGASLASAATYVLAHYNKAHLVVALADMPWIQHSTYLALRQALSNHAVVAPVFEQQRGHPVGFRTDLVTELTQLSGDQGAKALIKKYGVHPIAVTDPAVVWDVDHPSDLTRYYSMARDTLRT